MTELLLTGALIVMCFFVILAYRKGVKDGMRIMDKKDPEPIKTPVQYVKEKVEEHKAETETQELMDRYDKLMNFDPYEAIKHAKD